MPAKMLPMMNYDTCTPMLYIASLSHHTADFRCGTTFSLDQPVHLRCIHPKATITSVVFASIGNPTGACSNFETGACTILSHAV